MKTIDEWLTCLRTQFLEVSGLRLTPAQVQRLSGVEQTMCHRALESLVDEGLLGVKPDGRHARVADGTRCRPRAAEADLRTMATVRDASAVSYRAQSKPDETGGTVSEPIKASQTSMDIARDWRLLRTTRPNVLVTGFPDQVEWALAVLMPHLDPPIRWWLPDAPLPAPGDVKTLVIRHVDALSAEQQRDLSWWLEQTAVLTRVVSTTTVPLYQRVTAGLFLDGLYYRLNTMMVDARVTDDVRSAS